MKCVFILSIWLMTIAISSYSQPKVEIIRMHAIRDFPVLTREGKASNRKDYAPFHVEEDLNALAGDDLNFTFHMAAAEGIFPGASGNYKVCLNTLTERDGECVYNVYVNDEPVGLFQKNPPTNEFSSPATLSWVDVEIPAGAKIRVESNNWSNLLRHELNFFEYARGRWTSVDFIPQSGNDRVPEREMNLGIFEGINGIGIPDYFVRAKHNQLEDAYYVSAKGASDTQGTDCCGYVTRIAGGDFALEAFVHLIGLTDHDNSEAGLMIRQVSGNKESFIACKIMNNGDVALQYQAGTDTDEVIRSFTVKGAEMIQIERKANTFIMSAAKFGEEYERQSIELSEMSGPIKAGFFICSNNEEEREIARFDRVRFFEDISSNMEH